MNINHDKLSELIRQLYGIAQQLEMMFPGRHFTSDGHMVVSLGEALAAIIYGFDLMTASSSVFDAAYPCGKEDPIEWTTECFSRQAV